MIQSLLVATDMTEPSDEAVASGAALAADFGASFELFHCLPKPTFASWDGKIPRSEAASWKREARERMDAQIRRTGVAQPASLRLTLGHPAREISRHARSAGSHLVVLGAHRARPAMDTLLGGTAERVLRMSSVPCLVVNRPIERIRRLLIPVDFSKTSGRALEFALERLAPTASPALEMDLLFVSAFASPHDRKIDRTPMLDRMTTLARERLSGGAKVTRRIRSAPLPIDGITAVAEETNPDVVVLGTHGYSALGRALLGSVAIAAARTLRHPVVLVPPTRGR